ncbi:SDR family NAD(P)-dependent oxidoreductase [Conexibacter sp. W3-3-2]|nr:SDR family NAD(P)-dependent oxidoreductase [Conexibacter sp. W3-3-2]
MAVAALRPRRLRVHARAGHRGRAGRGGGVSRVRLAEALAVVTGAGSGIGAATARRFTAAGATVIGVDLDGDAVAEVCGASSSYVCDVADRAAVEELADRIAADHGDVDVLVNNAGVGVYGPFLDASLDDWDWLVSINLDGVAYGCAAFGRGMVERGRGQVVNVASGAAYIPNRNMAAYCATKSAVVALSQCLRADWRGSGVGVSVVCPGVISTPIARATRYVGREAHKADRGAALLARGHSPDLVAKAIADCVKRNRDVVPVGFESTLAYKLLRGAPQPIQGLVARGAI